MGWLLDELNKIDIKSPPKAVAAMMASNLRPREDDPIKDTSLANMVRQLDKGEASWWTSKGSAWIPALADVLSWDTTELRDQIQRIATPLRSGEADPEQLVSDWFLRPLDLAEEDLFPGLPPTLTRQRWALGDRVWWVAGTGAGRTLLGRWLCVRQGWERREARTWSEAVRDLPPRGKVYLELFVAEDTPVIAEAAPEGLRLCVAAPFRPKGLPTEARDDTTRTWAFSANIGQAEPTPDPTPGWEVLTSPPLEAWLAPLLSWVEAHLRPGGGYVAAEVRELLEKLPLSELVETPGDLLDLLALIDDSGVNALFGDEDREPLALVRAWIRRSCSRVEARLTPGVAALLRKSGEELIETLVMERLRQGLAAALTSAEWQALVPRRLSPPLDRVRLASLIEKDTKEARQQALAMLRPSAEDLISGLEAIRALVPDGSGRLALRPAWLANATTQTAVDALIEEGPEGVGALLLHEQTSTMAMELMLNQVKSGNLDLVTRCVQIDTDDSPELLAALDGAFRALGLQVSIGVSAPDVLLREAWDAQMQRVTRRFTAFPSVPIIGVAASGQDGLTAQDTWLLAALAISLRLVEAGHAPPFGPLVPWYGLPEDGSEKEAMFAAINHAMSLGFGFRLDAHADMARGAFRIAAAILNKFGLPQGLYHLAEVVAPLLLVRLARGICLPEGSADEHRLLELPSGLVALEDACAMDGASIDEVLMWCWRKWSDKLEQAPPIAWARHHREDSEQVALARRLWRALPDVVITDSVLSFLARVPAVWPVVSEELWRRWLLWRVANPHRWPLEQTVWRAMPVAILREAALTGLLRGNDHDARRALWSREADAALALVDQLASGPPVHSSSTLTQLVELCFLAPDEQMSALLARTAAWIRSPERWPGVGDGLDYWLAQVVTNRRTGWREAFSLLRELSKSQLNPALQAPSAT